MDALADLGLEARAEVRVGRYVLDALVDEVWLGFEADGKLAHAGPRKRKRDAGRDEWILVNARIPILRLDEWALKRVNLVALKARVEAFIEERAVDIEERRAEGRWLVD
jgi:very-short-patch-repair endonuclease